VHSLSVGEARSANPLIRGLRQRFSDRPIWLSVTTVSGYETANSLMGDVVDGIFFYPYDLGSLIGRIADRIRPGVAIIVESDIWPNALSALNDRNIPVLLCNGRLSDRSFKRYLRVPWVARAIFSGFPAICAQSESDKDRFVRLGIDPDRVHMTGNIKYDQAAEPMSLERIAGERKALGIEPDQTVLLAGSTHKGEEAVLLDAFGRLRQSYTGLVLMVAPRDPKRAATIGRMTRSRGYGYCMLSTLNGEPPAARGNIWIIDVLGVLKRFYEIADIAFVGGSLIPAGGHNPLEPAMYAKPILFGPDMSDFMGVADSLLDSGGAVQVSDSTGICREAETLLKDRAKARNMGQNAYRVFDGNKGAVGKVLNVVERYLN